MNKIIDTMISIGILLLLPLMLVGGSMVAESFDTCNAMQLLVGVIILAIDFANFLGILRWNYINN